MATNAPKNLYIRVGYIFMAKSRHKWHCGVCHGEILKLNKGKGKTYLFCPRCDNLVAYHNILPLLAAAAPMLFKGAKALGSKIMGRATQPSAQQELQAAGYPSKPIVIRQPILVDID